MSDEPDPKQPQPFWLQPDPDKPFFVQPPAHKLLRRGRGQYDLIWKRPDGKEVATRLTRGTFRMEGL